MSPLARSALAEGVGTALLVMTVVGSGIAAQRLSPDDAGLQLLQNALVTGAALVALILALGPVSAAFNPVVTFGGWITAAYWATSSTSFANPAVTAARTLTDTFAGIAPGSAPGFVAAQLLGGGIGLLTARALHPDAAQAAAVLADRQDAP